MKRRIFSDWEDEMYSYTDLLKDTAVHCRNQEETDTLIRFLEDKGHKPIYRNWSDYEQYYDILAASNPERAICRMGKSYYDAQIKIITIYDLEELNPPVVNISDFEKILME